MKRESFYDSKRKDLKIDFLADYRVVRKYFLRKHGIQQADFELLVKLHSINFIPGIVGTFIKEDFKNGTIVLSWNEDRWSNLRDNDEWIKVVRQRAPKKGRNFAIFGLSDKAKKMVKQTYEILCGEREIPESTQFNPIMKRESYTDKVYANAILSFNEALRKNKEQNG